MVKIIQFDILLKKLPKNDTYPFQLPFHAAFHTPLLEKVSKKAFDLIDPTIFGKPTTPLIDGRGKIWSTISTDTEALMSYTLGHQVLVGSIDAQAGNEFIVERYGPFVADLLDAGIRGNGSILVI